MGSKKKTTINNNDYSAQIAQQQSLLQQQQQEIERQRTYLLQQQEAQQKAQAEAAAKLQTQFQQQMDAQQQAYQSQLQQSQGFISNLTNQNQELNKQIGVQKQNQMMDYLQQKTQLNNLNKQFDERLNQRTNELQSLFNVQRTELERQLQGFRTTQDTLKSDYESKLSDLSNAKLQALAQNQDLTEQNKQLTSNIGGLTGELDTTKGLLSKIQSDLTTLQGQKELGDNRIQQLSNIRERTNTELNQAVAGGSSDLVAQQEESAKRSRMLRLLGRQRGFARTNDQTLLR